MPNEKQKEFISDLVKDISNNQSDLYGMITARENVGEQNQENYLKAAVLDAIESMEHFSNNYPLSPDQKDVPYILSELGLVDEKSKLLTEKGYTIKENYQALDPGRKERIIERQMDKDVYVPPKADSEKDIYNSAVIDLYRN